MASRPALEELRLLHDETWDTVEDPVVGDERDIQS
jgi:hypothetical protein